MKNLIRITLATFLGLVLLSCEREQGGVVDPTLGAIPFVESVALHFGNVDLDSSTTPNLRRNADGSYSIFDTLTALIRYGLPASDRTTERRLDIHWSIRSEDGSDEFGNGNGSLYVPESPAGAMLPYAAPVTITVQRADVGRALVSFSVTTPDGLTSNTVMSPLTVTRRNSSPVVWKVSIPDTIFRPTTGFELILFSAAVRDSDGYADIREVSFRRTLPTLTSSIQMFDDGRGTSGDLSAGDGWFSRTVRIDSAARLGGQVFEFLAMDKSGEFSLALVDTIVIEQR